MKAPGETLLRTTAPRDDGLREVTGVPAPWAGLGAPLTGAAERAQVDGLALASIGALPSDTLWKASIS